MTSLEALHEALDAYVHALSCGAPSLVQAELFADLRAAHVKHVTHLARTEAGTITLGLFERVFPALEGTR